jgi:hypothetical protein
VDVDDDARTIGRRLPAPAPANGHTDSTIEAVRLALDAIDTDRPGAFELGRTVLDSLTVPPAAADTAGLVCQLTLCHAQAAVLDKQPGEVAAPIDAATELAERFGATGDDSLGCDHSPAEVGLRRMWLALEAGEPDQVVSIARDVHPERHPFLTGRADYWMHYGQALAQLPGRRDDAVRALRTAEDLFPIKVRRDPLVRDVIATLRPGTRKDTIGMELRGMAHRAGLPI